MKEMEMPSWKVEPYVCPQCGRQEISYTKSYDADWKQVECEVSCGAIWVEYWRFVEFEMIEGVNNAKHIKE